MNPAAERPKTLSVSQLCEQIYRSLEESFPDVWVEGEISNCRLYPSGHTYLTLKDENSQISSVLFRGAASGIKFTPQDGLKVLVRGRVSVYTKRGDLQLVISYMEPLEKGGLQLAFEQLKAKLEKEGLFDPLRKKPLPRYPQKLGVITSLQGAAIRDILNILSRRWPELEILILPVQVQGDAAAPEIAQAVKDFNLHFPEADVLLLGRGGGSLEDLWAFNEEIVARAIASSKIPVISCVGHETDFTIADFVADLRAPTPSAAAEMAVPDIKSVFQEIDSHKQSLIRNIQHALDFFEQRLKSLSSHPFLKSPHRMIEEFMRRLDEARELLSRAITAKIELLSKNLALESGRLDALSPLKVLSRGYSVARSWPSLKILRSSQDVKTHDIIQLTLHQGEIFCEVTKNDKRI